jgi:biotin carboxyl carrier protein
VPKRLRLTCDGQEWIAEMRDDGVSLSGADAVAAVHDEGEGRFRVDGAPPRHGIAVMSGDVVWVSVDHALFEFKVGSATARSGARDQDALTPPMSATVVRIAVKAGEAVEANQVLVVLEAMKMELPIRAPRAGVIAKVNCREGELVQPGTLLVELGSHLAS